jgi:uncharacterized lipoprotein NlpE involved in copper resistance
MKKVILSAIVLAFLSCNNMGAEKITNREDTMNITTDSTDTTVAHPGTNGYAPPNAKGGDSLSNSNDSSNQK